MARRLSSLVVGFRRSLGLGLGVAAALFTILSGLGTAGDRALADLRGVLMTRPMSGDLVLVQIDAASLSQVGTWPWSRRLHAALIDRLRQAHVRQIAFAIDFSAQSNPADDAAMASAMARAPGLVILPESLDRRPGQSDMARGPIPILNAQARVGINMSRLDSDNVTRRQALWPIVNGVARPGMTAVMTGLRTPTATYNYLLDLRVDPKRVERLSAADLLAGRFDPAQLRGRTIVIGGTADEISDHLLLPRVGAVPAVYALVMGYETLRAGALIADSQQLPELAFVLLIGGFALITRSRRSAIAAFAAGFAALVIIPFIADAVFHIRLSVVPAGVALAAMFAVRATAGAIRLYRAGIATDAQSGLPNIVALREAAATNGFTDVGVARIDNLAEIRIVLADAAIAELMRKMCERLVLVADDLGVFHTSDGSFAWLVRPEAIEELGDRFDALHAIMASPIRVGARQVDVQITCGMSTGQVGITEALRAATVAAEQAAARGARWHAYSSSDHDEVAVRLSLIGELDGAIDLGQIFVAYQPKYDIATRTLSGAEALVRWLHPERGLIAPDHFIPLAEEHGRIAKLTHYVLDRALGDFSTLGGNSRPAVAVNLSVTLLSEPNLVEMVCDALWRHGMLPQQLTLEVTESAAMSSDDAAISALEKLRAMGVGISIDDYGTGQSTLNYLKRLPATEIKIDQSFIRGVADSRSDAILVASTIELGHQLGMKVVAEGVENEAILRKLEAAGCDVAQGYLIARPMPFADFARVYRDPPRVAA